MKFEEVDYIHLHEDKDEVENKGEEGWDEVVPYRMYIVHAPHRDEDELGDVCTTFGKCTAQPVWHRDEDEVGYVCTTCGTYTSQGWR